jgi:hypothetical protein
MNKTTVTATFEMGDYEVLCSGIVFEDSYGVPGSPVWNDVGDIELTEVSFCGEILDMNSISVDVEEMLLEEAGDIAIKDWVCDQVWDQSYEN